MSVESERTTYVLIDGENIDATLGSSIFGRRPHPNERPRWDRILTFAETTWTQAAKGLFFLAVKDDLPMSFIQALVALGFRPIPLSGGPTEKVVDLAIQRTLTELARRDADVMLASNDGDFLPQMEALLDGRRVGLLAFREFKNNGFAALVERGLEFYDLEFDVSAFNERLPRLRIIPIDEFDPVEFL
ncbi:MAG: NYN domain-containing protein [Marmoricola sp.]